MQMKSNEAPQYAAIHTNQDISMGQSKEPIPFVVPTNESAFVEWLEMFYMELHRMYPTIIKGKYKPLAAKNWWNADYKPCKQPQPLAKTYAQIIALQAGRVTPAAIKGLEAIINEWHKK